jgi:hypothetical protein
VNNEKDIEQKIEQAFQTSGEQVPEDRYFNKIWNTIEVRAPVGEKYYLRSIFSMILVFIVFVVFIIFYTDFLSSVLTLKEIRKENLKSYNIDIPRATALPPAAEIEISKGIRVSALKDSNILFKTEDKKLLTVELDFFNGHAIVDKSPDDRVLIVNLPGAKVKMNQGQCNIFCYDGMIRIIALSYSVEVEYGDRFESIKPGPPFYLLDGLKATGASQNGK